MPAWKHAFKLSPPSDRKARDRQTARFGAARISVLGLLGIASYPLTRRQQPLAHLLAATRRSSGGFVPGTRHIVTRMAPLLLTRCLCLGLALQQRGTARASVWNCLERLRNSNSLLCPTPCSARSLRPRRHGRGKPPRLQASAQQPRVRASGRMRHSTFSLRGLGPLGVQIKLWLAQPLFKFCCHGAEAATEGTARSAWPQGQPARGMLAHCTSTCLLDTRSTQNSILQGFGTVPGSDQTMLSLLGGQGGASSSAPQHCLHCTGAPSQTTSCLGD